MTADRASTQRWETVVLVRLCVCLACSHCAGDPAGAPGDEGAVADAMVANDGQGPSEPDAGVPNIGVWCDPAASDFAGNNPACLGSAQCLAIDDPANGMCVVFGCGVDLWETANVNEETCAYDFGDAYVCVDLDASFANDGEDGPLGQNQDRWDNVCVPKCMPRSDANDCRPEFACTPASAAYTADTDYTDLATAICLAIACGTTNPCLPGAICNETNGLCFTVGDLTARVGEPCTSDLECPPNGGCLAPSLAEGRLAQHNGYCTILGCRFAETLDEASCPEGSACDLLFVAGACMLECDPSNAVGCRGNDCDPGSGLTQACDWLGDYECTDWSGWSFVEGSGVICEMPWQCPCVLPGRTCVDPLTGLASVEGVCLAESDSTVSGPPCNAFGSLAAFCQGECVDLGSDAENCGTCGLACMGSTPNCVAGACVP